MDCRWPGNEDEGRAEQRGKSGGRIEWNGMEDGKRGWSNEMRDYVKFQIVFCHFHSVLQPSFSDISRPLLFRLALPCYCLPCSIERQTDIRLSHLHREGRIVLRFFRHFADYF